MRVGCEGADRRNNGPLPQLPAYNCNPQVSIKLPRCLFPWERRRVGSKEGLGRGVVRCWWLVGGEEGRGGVVKGGGVGWWWVR